MQLVLRHIATNLVDRIQTMFQYKVWMVERKVGNIEQTFYCCFLTVTAHKKAQTGPFSVKQEQIRNP